MIEMESEGKTVGEAVDSALKKAGLRRDQVEVQILQEAASGFMGFGGKPAKVRIVEKRWGPESEEPAAKQAPAIKNGNGSGRAPQRKKEARPPVVEKAPPAREQAPSAQAPVAELVDTKKACEVAGFALNEMLALMGFGHLSVATSWDGVQERVKANVEGQEVQRLIGKDGRALEACQSLLTLIVGRKLGTPTAVQVDALGYWEKKEEEILAVIEQGVERVRATGKSFRLEPMDSVLRRLVHRHLADHPDIVTVSEGEGSWRKIVLQPRKK